MTVSDNEQPIDDDAAEPAAPIVDERALRDAERIAEALVFASAQPVSEGFIAERVARGVDVHAIMQRLKADYAMRGVNLVQVDGAWAFRTAADLSFVIRRDDNEARKLSRAALEVLAIIAYHQPVTRAEIEDIRGVQTSKGTLDVLMEAGWVRVAGRREVPGRPVIYATTPDFLAHFGLGSLRELPGLEELRAAGLLDPVDDEMIQTGLRPGKVPGEDEEPDGEDAESLEDRDLFDEDDDRTTVAGQNNDRLASSGESA